MPVDNLWWKLHQNKRINKKKCIWKYHMQSGYHFVFNNHWDLFALPRESQWYENLVNDANWKVFPISLKLISPECRIYASVNWVIIGSDNGLLPVCGQAITRTNAHSLSIGPLGTSFCEIWTKVCDFSFMKMHLKMPSAKWQPFCPEEMSSWN